MEEEGIRSNLKSPEQKPLEEEQWTHAEDLMGAQSSIEWDILLTRGAGMQPRRDFTRESLFVKFDPLVEKEVEKRRPVVGVLIEIDEEKENVEPDEVKDDGGVKDARVPLLPRITESPVHDNASPLAVAVITPIPGRDLTNLLPEEITQEAEEQVDPTVQTMVEHEEAIQLAQKQLEELEAKLEATTKEMEEIKDTTNFAKEDLGPMEEAFADALMIYEGGKTLQKHLEQNQKQLEAAYTWMEKALAKREEKEKYLDKVVEEKLKLMKQDFEDMLKVTNNENYKLRTAIKINELKVQQLESTIEQIARDSADLQRLCDEFVQ